MVKKSLEYIQGVVCENYLVKPEALASNSKKRAIFYPRAVAMYLSRRLIPWVTLDEIGEYYGGREHNSAANAISQIQETIQGDAKELELMERLETEIKAGWKIPLVPNATTEFMTPAEVIRINQLTEELGFLIDSLRSRNIKC